jgi:DnaJ family protein A protein 2
MQKVQGQASHRREKEFGDLHPTRSKVCIHAPVAYLQLTQTREGDRITLEGEADQVPDQEPGDIVFHLREIDHDIFKRAGADLTAIIDITLAESLCGFSRVVLPHLDGRGIQLHHPKQEGQILRPGQVLKVKGEGMPHKKSEAKGDLYLEVQVVFPEDGFLSEDAMKKLQEVLPGPEPPIEVDTVDEVDYEEDADIEEFGAGSGDPRAGSEWVDEDEEGQGPQCAQQ